MSAWVFKDVMWQYKALSKYWNKKQSNPPITWSHITEDYAQSIVARGTNDVQFWLRVQIRSSVYRHISSGRSRQDTIPKSHLDYLPQALWVISITPGSVASYNKETCFTLLFMSDSQAYSTREVLPHLKATMCHLHYLSALCTSFLIGAWLFLTHFEERHNEA